MMLARLSTRRLPRHSRGESYPGDWLPRQRDSATFGSWPRAAKAVLDVLAERSIGTAWQSLRPEVWDAYSASVAGDGPPSRRRFGGCAGDRLGHAFAVGYPAALEHLSPGVRAALCALRDGSQGNSPRAIETTLSRPLAGYRSMASKTFVTFGTLAKTLIIVARTADKPDGRPDLVDRAHSRRSRWGRARRAAAHAVRPRGRACSGCGSKPWRFDQTSVFRVTAIFATSNRFARSRTSTSSGRPWLICSAGLVVSESTRSLVRRARFRSRGARWPARVRAARPASSGRAARRVSARRRIAGRGRLRAPAQRGGRSSESGGSVTERCFRSRPRRGRHASMLRPGRSALDPCLRT